MLAEASLDAMRNPGAFAKVDEIGAGIGSFAEDGDLLASMPDFYVDAERLKKREIKAVADLNSTA